jgi:hypothetical protein
MLQCSIHLDTIFTLNKATDMNMISGWKQRELEQMRKTFDKDAYFDEKDGVYRWKSNNAIPFKDMLVANDVPADTISRCAAVRDAELDASVALYMQMRDARTPEQIEEERAMARAEFGPGHMMMNILTGERWTT